MNMIPVVAALVTALAASSALAQDFPLTIEHKFGTTVIEQKPDRVASLDYAGADNLLALGIQPVTVRHWYGDYPRSVWPWADPLLEGEPEILRGDLNFEQIAAARPDVIIAVSSGITDEDYEKLSLIAPVVAVPAGVGEYALAWDERALLAARAVGELENAQAQVAAIEAQLQGVAEAHPQWEGLEAAVAFAFGQGAEPGAYTSYDIRAQLLSGMGFVTPDAIDARVADTKDFYVYLSPEDLTPLDADLLVWVTSDDWAALRNVVARPFLAATRDGREVLLDVELSGALSHASLLSLPFAIDEMVPMLEAALDGDPQTHADNRPEDM